MSSPSISVILKTQHSIKDRLYWNFLNLLPFLVGSISIARDSIKWVAVYIGIALFFFLVIELRFVCTHCFYYIRSKGCVKCMMFSGVPKIFKDRPGFHTPFEKIIIVLGVFSVFLFPVYWLFRDPLLLGAYVISWGLFFFTVWRYGCIRCINFEFPVNRAPAEMRSDFKKKGDPFDISRNEFRVSGSNRCAVLKVKHEFKDFIYWSFVTLVLLFSAGLAIGIHSTEWMIAYIFLIFFHFYILEQRFFCTHCPYYAMSENKVRCMMNWSWPKYFRSRSYPPGKFDLAVTTLGFLVVIFFPLSWLLKEPFLLGAYLVSISIFLLTIWRYECCRCIYFGCPFNKVSAEVRKEFEGQKRFECEFGED
jgi:hypothetical protein